MKLISEACWLVLIFLLILGCNVLKKQDSEPNVTTYFLDSYKLSANIVDKNKNIIWRKDVWYPTITYLIQFSQDSIWMIDRVTGDTLVYYILDTSKFKNVMIFKCKNLQRSDYYKRLIINYLTIDDTAHRVWILFSNGYSVRFTIGLKELKLINLQQ